MSNTLSKWRSLGSFSGQRTPDVQHLPTPVMVEWKWSWLCKERGFNVWYQRAGEPFLHLCHRLCPGVSLHRGHAQLLPDPHRGEYAADSTEGWHLVRRCWLLSLLFFLPDTKAGPYFPPHFESSDCKRVCLGFFSPSLWTILLERVGNGQQQINPCRNASHATIQWQSILYSS